MSFLQCEVCNEDYSDVDEDHIPKILKCGHSICQNCATHLITALLIICPFCRETTKVRDGDDQKLQKNFALVQAIQAMKADSPPKCEEHPYNLAEFVCVKPRCSSSNKLMCKTCEEFGVHRNHKKSLLLSEASSLRESLGFRIEKRETQIEKLQEDINTINLLVWKKIVAEFPTETKNRKIEFRAQLGNMEDGDEFKEKAKKITAHYANLNLRLYEEKAQALTKLKAIAKKNREANEETLLALTESLDKLETRSSLEKSLLEMSNAEIFATDFLLEPDGEDEQILDVEPKKLENTSITFSKAVTPVVTYKEVKHLAKRRFFRFRTLIIFLVLYFFYSILTKPRYK